MKYTLTQTRDCSREEALHALQGEAPPEVRIDGVACVAFGKLSPDRAQALLVDAEAKALGEQLDHVQRILDNMRAHVISRAEAGHPIDMENLKAWRKGILASIASWGEP